MKNKKHNLGIENKKPHSGTGNSLGLYTFGALNLSHAAFHLIQVVQSTYLATSNLIENSHNHDTHNSLEEIFHNPYMGILWGAIGIGSIYMGYLDRKNHKKQGQYINEQNERISKQDEYIIKIEKENLELKEANSNLEAILETKI